MPSLPPVSKVIRVDLFQSIASNQRVRDRIFFSFTGAGPAAADLNTLETTIGNAWNTNISPLQPVSASLLSVACTDLTSNTGAQTQTTQAHAGTRAGTNSAAGSAAVIRFKIARRYRGGHPRLYLYCGITTDQTDARTWSTTFNTAVINGWNAFITACEATPPTNIGTLAHVNVSYFAGFHNVTFPSGRQRAVPTLRGTPQVDAVQSYSMNGIIASQRRRYQQSP